MAMAVDNRHEPQMQGMGYDSARAYQAPPQLALATQFTDPWSQPANTSAPSSSTQFYHSNQGSPISMPAYNQQQPQRSTPTSMHLPPPSLMSSSTPVTSAGYYIPSYPATTSLPMSTSYATTSAPVYQAAPALGAYSQYDPHDRRVSSNMLGSQRSFSDAIKGAQGVLSLNHSDITPRNIYGDGHSSRSSSNSYGFPSTHSAHSSISGASSLSSQYQNPYTESVGSVASSSDYGSIADSVDLSSRTLPRLGNLSIGLSPPAPQSMMGQFSSKISTSSQKKHKCKICDKRFTRPSSLQTHVYSHTGEKPYACEVEGCGRHFSVVSNLRRHMKVHRNDPKSASDAKSSVAEDESES